MNTFCAQFTRAHITYHYLSMKKIHSYNGLTWIDLNDPSKDEVRNIMDEYNINPQIADDLISPTVKPQVNTYDNYVYMVLHFPASKHSHTGSDQQEVDFIISEDALITVRYDLIDSIHKFAKEFDVESVIGRENIGDHAGYILYHLLQKLYKSIDHELEYIDSHLRDIEEKIFNGKEKQMVQEISKMSRVLLDFEQTTSTHTTVLESFKNVSMQFFGDDFTAFADSLITRHNQVLARITRHRKMIRELRETNDSLVSTKQNEVMKVLTIMAFVTFPLSLLASIFGMNTISMPIIGHPYDFWIITGTMVGLMLLFFVFFKYKRWV